MQEIEGLFSRRLEKHISSPPGGDLPNIDRWLAASALQKAVRRGNEEEALSCARLLSDVDPQRLWRRIAVIAMEDVGVGDVEATTQALWACRSKAWRGRHGGEWHVASCVVSALCRALKSRDTDDLSIVADRHPDFGEHRVELASAPTKVLRDVLADRGRPLPARALAALYLLGTSRYTAPFLPERPGDIRELLDVYQHLGVPEHVLGAVVAGAAKERGPLPVNLGLLWLHLTALRAGTRSPRCGAGAADGDGTVSESRPVSLGRINGVSSEAYDMHTRTGKQALAYFSRACAPVREHLSRHVPDGSIYALVSSIVFRVEGARLDRRLVYEGSAEIEAMAGVAELAHDGLPVQMVPEALDVVRRHLPDLHRARLRVVEG